ncbi:MAG: PilN domain-containing protein, partial [Phycisphaeraceae bacterium]
RSLAGEANEKGFEHSASGTGRRMALLGAWAVLAALGLFGLDHYRAVQAEAAAAALGKAAGGETQLERQLALGQYLQQGPAPPLMVLEEVARRLERKVVLSEWHYDREGEIRFGGAVGRFAEFEEMLRKLDALPMFEEVRLTSAAEEKRKWKFQIRATLAPAYRWQPARPKADTTEADQEGAK